MDRPAVCCIHTLPSDQSPNCSDSFHYYLFKGIVHVAFRPGLDIQVSNEWNLRTSCSPTGRAVYASSCSIPSSLTTVVLKLA